MAISYVALYSLSQLGIFFLRGSEPAIFLGLKQAQWTALGMLVLGVPLLVVLWRRTRTRGLVPSERGEAEASLPMPEAAG
jgi:prolipoprotein diacylglyceryltransferase